MAMIAWIKELNKKHLSEKITLIYKTTEGENLE